MHDFLTEAKQVFFLVQAHLELDTITFVAMFASSKARLKNKKGNKHMRSCKHYLAVIFIVITVTGCASLPSPEKMKAQILGYELPQLPPEGKAIIYIVRPSSLGGLIRFNVFVNDKEPESEVGYTRSSQYIYFYVEPGEHQILSKAENWAETNITATAGDIIFIQQEPSIGIIMARNSLFKLQDYEGKYHVKTTSLGTVIKTEK
jgi:hypothetical protein